jgi:hypothetical protein
VPQSPTLGRPRFRRRQRARANQNRSWSRRRGARICFGAADARRRVVRIEAFDQDPARCITCRRASVAVSTLVGAVLLERALDDEALSDEILRDVRAALKLAR